MTTIWTQCEVVQIRLETAPAGTASNLEGLVMRAIGTGVNGVAALAGYFGLTEGLMLDLVGDLWRAERLTILFGERNEKIILSSKAREELAAGDDVEASMRSVVTEAMAFDILTGRVLPLGMSRAYPRDRRLVVPRQADDPKPQSLRAGRLAEVVAFALTQRGDSIETMGDHRIVAANLVPHIVTKETQIRYAQVEVQAQVDADGNIRVHLLESNWPLTLQRTTNERLQRLVNEQPTSAFARALASEASHRLHEAPSLGAKLAQLAETAAALQTIAVDQRQSRHDALKQAYADLGRYVADMAYREVTAQVLKTAVDHQQAIDYLIGTATTQLVIALPWIYYHGLRPYLPVLEAAVSRGVGLTVLWGIDRNESSLEPRVMRAFDDLHRSALEAGRGGYVHVDRRQSSHIHAKVLVRDDSAGLVTSKNFFSSSDHLEMGVLVEAQPNSAAPVVADLVSWAYQTTPNFAHAGHLIRDPAVFRARQPSPGLVVDVGELNPDGHTEPTSTFLPPEAPELDDAVTSATTKDLAAPRLWARAWQEVVGTLRSMSHRPSPVCYLIADGLHHSMLIAALREAKFRIIVASGKLSRQVITADFIRQLEVCLQRGVHVSLYFGSLSRTDDERVLKRLTELAASGIGTLEIVPRAGSHAKVLVIDNEVVIGSYNYLAFDAVYGAGRRRQRAEISLRFISPPMADHVAQILSGTRNDEDGLFHFVATVAETPPTAISAGRLAAMLTRESLDLDEVAAIVPDIDSHTRIRGELTAVVDSDWISRFDAAVVASASNPHLGQRGLENLIQGLWGRGRVVPAAALRASAEGAWAPDPPLTRAVAATVLRTPDATLLAEDLALSNETSGAAAACLAVVEVIETLRDGDESLLASAILISADFPEFQAWLDAAQAFVRRYGSLQVRHFRPTQESGQQHAGACSVIVDGVDRLAGWRPGFWQTAQAASWMLAGPLGELRAAAAARDIAAIVLWVAANPGGVDGEWLDDMVRRSGIGVTIHSSHRRRLITSTRELLVTARRLAKATAADGTERRTGEVDDQERAAATSVAELALATLDALPEQVETSAARAWMRTFLDELGVVR